MANKLKPPSEKRRVSGNGGDRQRPATVCTSGANDTYGKLEAFFSNSSSPLVFLDRGFNFIRVNEAYAKACGRKVSDFDGHNHFADYPSDELREQFQRVVDSGEPYSVYARPFTFPDHPEWGTTYWDLFLYPVLGINGKTDFLVFALNDVTVRKLAELKAERLTRLYSLLSQVNEAIVRTKDRRALFEAICRIVVETGKFRLAWVGLVDRITLEVRPAASFGAPGYLDGLKIIAADVPEGRGPAARCLIEKRCIINSDFEQDEALKPWRERARTHGIRSSSAFPLRVRDEIVGTLLIYSDQPHSFSEEETQLLAALSDDISFAMEAMENEHMRREAEEALHDSAKEMYDLYHNAPCGYHSLDKDGVIVRMNSTELGWLGYSSEEVLGRRRFADFMTTESMVRFEETFPLFKKQGSIRDVEFEVFRKDGTTIHVLVNATAISDKDGNFLMSRSTLNDITERKESERRRHIINTILNLFVHAIPRKDYLEAVVKLIHEWSKCDCIGIRVLDTYGDTSDSNKGIGKEFMTPETLFSTIRDNCSCAAAAEKAKIPGAPPYSAFYSQNAIQFASGIQDDEKDYRLACNRSGLKSIAVVPIRHQNVLLGIIHCADRTAAKLSRKEIEFLESLSSIIGEALYRFNTEEKIKQSQDELRKLSLHLQEMIEAERTSIAREIHDELGQLITALRMDLFWMKNNFADHDIISNKTGSMLSLIDTMMQSVQNIIAALRPGILDVLGIIAAIEWLASEFSKQTGVPCNVLMPPEEFDVPGDISINIFRLVQEMLTNIKRHAKASSVVISIEKKEEGMQLKVEDDGIGVTTQDIAKPTSFGIIGMRERVYSMHGNIDISGISGKGTSITIYIPVNKPDTNTQTARKDNSGSRC